MKDTLLDKVGFHRPFINLFPDESRLIELEESKNILKYTGVDIENKSLEDLTENQIISELEKNNNKNYNNLKEFTQELESYLSFLYYPHRLTSQKYNEKNNKFRIKYNHPIIDSIEGRLKDPTTIYEKYTKKKEHNTQTPIKDLNGILIVIKDNPKIAKFGNYSMNPETTKDHAELITEFLTNQEIFNPLKNDGEILKKDYFSRPQKRTYNNKTTEFKALYSFLEYNNRLIEVQIRPLSVHKETKNPRSPLNHKVYEYKKCFFY